MTISIITSLDSIDSSTYVHVLAEQERSAGLFINNNSVNSLYKQDIFNTNNLAKSSEDSRELLEALTEYILPISDSNYYLSDTGIIPPGLLFLNKNFLVFERPPTYQTVFLIPTQVDRINYESDCTLTFRIPIPWQLYIVHYTGNYGIENSLQTSAVRMHFMHGPLSSLDQVVYSAPLPNFYGSGDLCRPMFSDMDDLERYPKNISGVMQAAYDWVWNSGTNLDLTDTIANYYIQARYNSENTLFSATSCAIRNYPIGSYYAGSEHVVEMFEAWEKLDLTEVSFLRWTNPSRGIRYINDYQEARQERLGEYQRQHNSYVSTDDFCEECAEYDDDDDEVYHSDECECSCHNPPDYDELDFLAWAGLYPTPPVTFEESFARFEKNNPTSHSAYSTMTQTSDLVKRRFQIKYQSIVDSIFTRIYDYRK